MKTDDNLIMGYGCYESYGGYEGYALVMRF